MRKTKIISTLGPATYSKIKICRLISAGMDVARINMSHISNYEKLKQNIGWIREEADNIGKSVAILLDLCGPKIRVGEINGIDHISIVHGQEYTLGFNNCDIIFISINEFSLVLSIIHA